MKKFISHYPAKKMMALVCLLIVSSISTFSVAEVREKAFEISPFVGHNFFESKQNLNDGFVHGVRFGYNVTQNWAVEAAVSFIDSSVENRELTGGSEGQYRSPITDVDLTAYHIDALYHFSPERSITPYLVVGYGATHYSPEIADKDMSTFNFGAGAKYWVRDNLALRFEVRDYLVSEVFQEHYHNVQATLGVVFSFGGSARSTPPAATTPVAQPAAEEEIVLQFSDVHFEFDSAELTSDAQAKLRDNIRIMQANPDVRVRIAGHTSASGSAEYNQRLSERRARSVQQYLVSEGVRPNRLSTIGYGETRPAQRETDPRDIYSPAATSNMRVLFEIIMQ